MTASATGQPVSLRPRRRLGRSQAQIWASQRVHPEVPLANMAKRTTIDGTLEPARFVAAFETVVRAADALRGRIVDVEGVPQLRVESEPPATTEVIDLPEHELDDWCAARISAPVDATTCAYDSVLIRHRDDRWTWWLDLHHAITDAMASALVFESTAAAYAGEPLDLGSLRDHLAALARAEATDAWRLARDHWTDQQRPTPPLSLYGAPGRATTAVDRAPVGDDDLIARLDDALGGTYRSLSRELALLAIIATAVVELVHRLDGRDEIVLGVPVHQRNDREAKRVVGPLMELFPLRVTVGPDDTHRTLHKRIARGIMKMLRSTTPGTSPDQDFSVVLNVLGARYGSFAGLPATTRWPRSGHADPAHLIRAQISAYDDDLRIELDINHALGSAADRARLPDHVGAVLDRVLADPDESIGAEAIATTVERAAQERWQSPPAVPPASLDVAGRVSASLRSMGSTLAIEDGDRSLSGLDLDDLIGRIAAWFRREGIGVGDRVAIRRGRSIDAVALIHGALRAGVTFVPLDPADPSGRHDRIVDDAAISRVLDAVPDDLPDLTDPPAEVDPDVTAYVLYTSGSTGLPKGVPISRRGLDDYLTFAESAYLDGERAPTVALHSSLVFDLTITSLFLPLLAGGRLVVFGGDGPTALAEVAGDPRIDWLKATPSQLELIVRMTEGELPYRTLVVGGEAFRRPLARRLVDRCAPGVAIYNEYGPTEAVVGCMIHRFDPELDTGPDVPIGAPAPGSEVRLLDAHRHPVPIGAWGELWVRRPGVAEAYLHRQELTAERFVVLDDGRTWYRTGDRARFERDGVTVYGGRADDQLKVGGVRLEPGEVEAALATHPGVDNAVVRVWTPTQRPPSELHRCPRCGLGDDVPDISFDEHGVCSTCRTFDVVRPQAEVWFKTEDDLLDKLSTARRRRRGDIDAIHLLSGGKDSTFALYRLVEQGWNVHALTLDNGFISDGAKENVRRSVADLGITHEFMTTEAMNDIFRDSLDRYSNVCQGCFKTIYTLAVHRARELGAPVIVTGLSRGQFFETRLVPHQFDSGRFDPDAIDAAVLEARKAYHRTPDAVTEHLDNSIFDDDAIFDEVEFVDFYRYVDVDLAELYDFLEHRAPWVRPADTGRSTNCLVNIAGIHVHRTERAHHNYAEPYAWDVRLGHKTREEALDELDDDFDMTDVDRMLDEIGYQPQPPELLTAWYRSEEPIEPQELRDHLRDLVPAHAIPAAFVRVDDLPLAASAKVDVAALPAPTRFHRQSAEFRAPSSSIERRLAAIWAEVLGLEQVGLDDDFFDIGGDSLAALEMITWAADQLAVDVPDASAFQRRTLGQLAELFAAAERSGSSVDEAIADADGPPPVSPGQAALRFDVRSDTTSPRYTITRRHRVDGTLDVDRLHDALLTVIDHHETLRWTFSEPRRELSAAEALEWSVVSPIVDIDALAHEQSRRRFDIEAGPLLRATVVRGVDGADEVLLSAHHLWCDARSFDLLWHHLDAAYRGHEPDVPPIGYGQLAARHRSRVDGDAIAAAAAAVPDDAHAPALDLTPPTEAEPDGYRRLDLTLDAPPDRIVPAFLAAVALAFVDDESSVVGLPMTTRDADARASIGYFLNTVPLQLPLPDHGTFDSLVREVDDRLAGAFDHRMVPFADLVAERRRHSRSTDLATVMVVHDPPTDELTIGGARVPGETIFNGAAITDLSLFVTETPTGAVIAAEWSGRRFAADDIDTLLSRLAAILRTGTSSPDLSLDAVAETTVGSAAELPGPRLDDVTSSVLDDIWALHDDDRPAVRYGDETLTYRELIARAERLAAVLAEQGVASGDLVAVSLPRRTELVVALLGVMRLGAAYVPIDPTYPAERVAAILDSARPGLLVTDRTVADLGSDLATLDLDEAIDGPTGVRELAPMPDLDAPAYVIHTSGSTGTPRGVLVRHRQLASSNRARRQHYDHDPLRFLWTSSFGFDSSVVGLFWTLSTGGELILPAGADGIDVEQLVTEIEAHRVSHLLTVPSLWGAIEARLGTDLPALGSVIVAGEACPAELVSRHVARRPDVELWNEYGPTEATVWATVARCEPGVDPVPIGSPIPGTVVRIADRLGRAVVRGAAGELLIGGAGLTDGYLDDAEATTARFVTDGDGRRWYRSGDRARLSDDTTIEFLGRIDDQLSVGGVRVEPAEIERVVERHPGVVAAITRVEPRLSADPTDLLARLDPADQRRLLADAARADDPAGALIDGLAVELGAPSVLVAHVEVDHATELDDDELIAFAAARLPANLVPRRVVRHDLLPRTPHGKLDRRAVPRAARVMTTTPAPTSPVVEQMVETWREVFGIDDLGPDADFLASGGDSLLALELVDVVRERFDGDLDVADLLERSTPAAMAALLERSSPGPTAPGVEHRPEGDTDLVVTMRSSGSTAAAVFVVPPAGGLLFTSQPLADALDGHTVLGLQYPGADGRGRTETSITGLARRFLPQVQAAQPDGPIRLVGASTGGLVAAELGELLASAGRDVELVALVDTYTPGQRLGLWRARRDKYVGLVRAGRLTSIPAELGRKLLDRRRLATTPPGADTKPAAPGSTVEVPRMLDIARRAEVAHRLTPTRLPVVLYAASETNPNRTVRGWSKAAEQLIVVELDGTHTGARWIMGPAQVAELADDLVNRL